MILKPAYHLGLTCLFSLCAFISRGQLTQVFHDVYYTDDGSVAGYPAGASTYRIWAQMDTPDDALTAVYAAENNSLLLGTTDELGIWNTSFGGIAGPDLNPAFFGTFPQLEYDSMVTIGRADQDAPGGTVTVVSALPSASAFADSFSTTEAEDLQPDLVLEDGAWFSVANNANVFGQGEDNLILLAQITTVAALQYQLNVQILIGGAGGESVLYVWDPEAVDQVDNEVDGSLLGLEYPSSLCVITDVSVDYSCGWIPKAQEVGQQFTLNMNASEGCSPDSIQFVETEPPFNEETFDLEALANEIVTTGSADASDLLSALMPNTSYSVKVYFTNVEGPGNETTPFVLTTECADIPGCSAQEACNYDPQATINDGSCRFQSNTSIESSLSLHVYPTGQGVPYNGTFECDALNGAWFCVLPANDSISIYVSGADFNVRMCIYDFEQTLLTTVDDEIGGEETVEDFEVSPGAVHYIQVQGEGLPPDPADYDFDIVITDSSGTELVGDLDGNGILTSSDLLEFLPVMGTSNAIADFDGSGVVSTWDFLLLLVQIRQEATCP